MLWLMRAALRLDCIIPPTRRLSPSDIEGTGQIGPVNIDEPDDGRPLEEPAKNSDKMIDLDALLRQLAHLNLEGRVNKASVETSHGGYSDIYVGSYTRADHTTRKVAVKKIRAHIMEDRKLRKALAKELYIWSKLNHLRILPLEGFYIEDGSFPHLVSTWMEKGTILKYLEVNLNADILSLVTGVAEGIHYLHSKGVVHSDIKPDNVLISDDGEPVLCDFGVSRMLASSRTLNITSTSGTRGTVRYMSKEILQPDKDEIFGYSKKSDVWAFGMTTFAILTRKAPFYEFPSDASVILAVVAGKLPTWPASSSPAKPSSEQALRGLCQFCWVNQSIRERISTIVAELYNMQKWLQAGQAHSSNSKCQYKYRFLRKTEFLGAAEEHIAKLDRARARSSGFQASTSTR